MSSIDDNVVIELDNIQKEILRLSLHNGTKCATVLKYSLI